MEVQNGALAPAVALARCRGGGCLRGMWPPSEVGAFFENVGSNEAIWCTIFHYVEHLTACLLGCFYFYFRTGWSKKWRGHAPQSEKNIYGEELEVFFF